MNNQINVALQVLPQSKTKDSYAIVDAAIEEIQKSGLRYKVTPFETVIEGKWDEVMALVKRVHEICYENETFKMLAYLKIQTSNEDVTIEQKIGKYES